MTYQLRSTTITFDAALRDLESKSDRARAQAAHALGDVVAPDERKRAVKALIAVLEDPRPEVRTEAALSLGDLETEAAVEPLVARFDDSAPAVRQAAAVALGRLGFSSSFDAVARALDNGPPDLRFQAATSLVEIDPERAREPLLAALGDSDGEVVGAAALGLGAIGERRAIERLAGLLEDWDRPATRFDIAYALADFGDARAVPILLGLLEHKDLAWDAIESLDKVIAADPSAAKSVAKPLAEVIARRFARPEVKLRAAAALLAMADGAKEIETRARKTLLAGLSARKLELRGLAVQLLGKVGGKWAIGPLEALRRRRAGRLLADEIDDCLEGLRS